MPPKQGKFEDQVAELKKMEGVATKWVAGERAERMAKRLGLRTEVVRRCFKDLGAEDPEGKSKRQHAQGI